MMDSVGFTPHWPDPLELQDLKDAVENHRYSVILNDRKFTIRYEGDWFYVKPVAGFIPCGWFELRTAFAEIE